MRLRTIKDDFRFVVYVIEWEDGIYNLDKKKRYVCCLVEKIIGFNFIFSSEGNVGNLGGFV